MRLGGRIAQIRADRAIEQEEICAKVPGLSQQALSALERRDSATSEFAIRIADALGVSVRWLLDGQGSPADAEWPFQRVDRARWQALDVKARDAVEGAVLLTLAQLETASPGFQTQTSPAKNGAAARSSPSKSKSAAVETGVASKRRRAA